MRARYPLSAVDAVLSCARPAACVPDSLSFGGVIISRPASGVIRSRRQPHSCAGAADKTVMAHIADDPALRGFDERFLLSSASATCTPRRGVSALIRWWGRRREMLLPLRTGTASSPRPGGHVQTERARCSPQPERICANTNWRWESDVVVDVSVFRYCVRGSLLLSPAQRRAPRDGCACPAIGSAHLLNPGRPADGRRVGRRGRRRCASSTGGHQARPLLGPVGWWTRRRPSEFAIALRCGLASGTRLRALLFAGAGIMRTPDRPRTRRNRGKDTPAPGRPRRCERSLMIEQRHPCVPPHATPRNARRPAAPQKGQQTSSTRKSGPLDRDRHVRVARRETSSRS